MQRDMLKKLLMKRAIQTIPIIMLLQNEGSSIDRLYKKGMLTDDMHFKAKELRTFVDQEVQDVQFEADELAEGWGQVVWQQAMQFHRTIQKQAESKAEEIRSVEDEKKKAEAARRKEKERAKKLAALREARPAEEMPSSSTAQASAVVRVGVEKSEQPEAQDASKLEQQLIEEEEREKSKAGGKKKKKATNKNS
jgi:hypothetical protein